MLSQIPFMPTTVDIIHCFCCIKMVSCHGAMHKKFHPAGRTALTFIILENFLSFNDFETYEVFS
jgi:hypothetical protein